jgi:hypothetical protein
MAVPLTSAPVAQPLLVMVRAAPRSGAHESAAPKLLELELVAPKRAARGLAAPKPVALGREALRRAVLAAAAAKPAIASAPAARAEEDDSKCATAGFPSGDVRDIRRGQHGLTSEQ